MEKDESEFTTNRVPLTVEYHINKLLINDGYSQKIDPYFTPLVYSSYKEAEDKLKTLNDLHYLTKVYVPDWDKNY